MAARGHGWTSDCRSNLRSHRRGRLIHQVGVPRGSEWAGVPQQLADLRQRKAGLTKNPIDCSRLEARRRWRPPSLLRRSRTIRAPHPMDLAGRLGRVIQLDHAEVIEAMGLGEVLRRGVG